MNATALMPLLNVADVEASIAWYGRFGFEIEHEFKDDAGTLQWAQVRSADAALMLNKKDLIAADDRHARPDFGDAVFYITVPDAAATHKMLADAGIAAPAPEKQMYGVLEFHLRDLDGYEIAIGSMIEG